MKAVLVRTAVDAAYGKWNGPVNAHGQFVYVPIPESIGTTFHPKHERAYREVMPALAQFAAGSGIQPNRATLLPSDLHERHMHLDPDFEHLTYGDDGSRRGRDVASMAAGDLIVFYSGLRPIHSCDHNLIYALVGLFVVEDVVAASAVPSDRYHENAHTRKIKRGESDIVARARRGVSGRLERCIPFGEFRDRAYRVRKDVLDDWGGLSVSDGYVQRSAVPPRFLDPSKFYAWFQSQAIPFLERNN